MSSEILNRTQDTDAATRVRILLATLRRSRVERPASELLDRSPLSISTASDLDAAAAALGRSFPADTCMAFDLDDTLLNISYTCGEAWDVEGDATAFGSIQYAKMQRSPWRVLKYGWRLPRRFHYDPQRYRFLNNPQVFVQIRPGMLAALQGLKSAGVKLALVTASARSRLDFLLARLPLLREIFSEGDRLWVAAAEDLLEFTLDLYLHPERYEARSELDVLGLAIHAERPLSLAMKTPFALKHVLGLADYDLLIDDSTTTASSLRAGKLGQKLLQIDPRQPQTPYVLDILQAARRQLDGQPASTVDAATSSDAAGYDPKTYPHLRFEDPLYYPLIHLSDRVELEHV
ncbi:MAG: hypothetical protein AAFX40_07290 [Cyanobacteria bacterium J06639_1]